MDVRTDRHTHCLMAKFKPLGHGHIQAELWMLKV